jgi:hypothetical protein
MWDGTMCVMNEVKIPRYFEMSVEVAFLSSLREMSEVPNSGTCCKRVVRRLREDCETLEL